MEAGITQLGDDVSTVRSLKQRRKQIGADIRRHEQAIRSLQQQLDELEDFSRQSAEIAAQLDSLNFGDGWQFAMQLRDALVSNQTALKSRVQQARKQLPQYDSGLYEEIRLEHDERYRKQKESSESIRRQVSAAVEKNRKLDEAARNPKQAVVDAEGYVVGYK